MDNERIKKHYINSLSKFLPEDIKNNFDIDWDGYNVNIDDNAECDYGTVTGKDGVEGAYFEFTNKSNPEERYSVTYGIVGNFSTWQTEGRAYDRNGDPGDPGDMGDYEFTDFDDETAKTLAYGILLGEDISWKHETFLYPVEFEAVWAVYNFSK